MFRRGSGGTLERTYKVAGDGRPYDADAKSWFSETLTYLFRRTGFMAEERSRWILDTRGIQGLMDELAELSGDYTRRIYYQAAVQSGKLDAAGYERIVTVAGQTISSDYEHRRVLDAVVKRTGTSPAMLLDVLTSAKTINSDYELAELLSGVAASYVLDDALRPAFFAAAKTLNSDFEHGRTLLAVVEHGELTAPVTLAVLESAKTMSSDHELSELLVAVIGRVRLDATIRRRHPGRPAVPQLPVP